MITTLTIHMTGPGPKLMTTTLTIHMTRPGHRLMTITLTIQKTGPVDDPDTHKPYGRNKLMSTTYNSYGWTCENPTVDQHTNNPNGKSRTQLMTTTLTIHMLGSGNKQMTTTVTINIAGSGAKQMTTTLTIHMAGQEPN